MALTDTHCHLNLESFAHDREQVLQRARERGLVRILVPGLTTASSRAAVNLAGSDDMLFAAVGVHPNDALTWDPHESIQELKDLANNRRVVGIGEIGLDYYWDRTPHQHQQKVLQEQLDLASALSLPVVLHSRESGDAQTGDCSRDLMGILEDWVRSLRSKNPVLGTHPGVLHSFSGEIETGLQAINLGFYLGITGPITYKNAETKRHVIQNLPLERQLIETDSPFLAPLPYRGKRNEPAFVSYIADKIAQVHNTTPQEVARVTSRNAAELFGWGESI